MSSTSTSGPVRPAASAEGPAELWLQLHGDCTDEETREPVDYENDGVTWCWHAIHDSDVRYVRADLAQPVQPSLTAAQAAAPELLEALQATIAYWDEVVPPVFMNEHHKAGRAVIAKATRGAA